MKLLLSLALSLSFLAHEANAQARPAAPANQAGTAVEQDEVRALAVRLKEAYGAVTQEVAALEREQGTDATKLTGNEATLRDRLKTSVLQIEGMLTTVSTGDKAQWGEIKAKAEQVLDGAGKLLAERKATKK
jgi:hypothetical protein